jgi:hypothetical protein
MIGLVREPSHASILFQPRQICWALRLMIPTRTDLSGTKSGTTPTRADPSPSAHAAPATDDGRSVTPRGRPSTTRPSYSRLASPVGFQVALCPKPPGVRIRRSLRKPEILRTADAVHVPHRAKMRVQVEQRDHLRRLTAGHMQDYGRESALGGRDTRINDLHAGRTVTEQE